MITIDTKQKGKHVDAYLFVYNNAKRILDYVNEGILKNGFTLQEAFVIKKAIRITRFISVEIKMKIFKVYPPTLKFRVKE